MAIACAYGKINRSNEQSIAKYDFWMVNKNQLKIQHPKRLHHQVETQIENL